MIAQSERSFAQCAGGKNATPSDTGVYYLAGFTPNYFYDPVYAARAIDQARKLALDF